jgi:predicted O-methyltransferase YrrM
MLNGDGELVTLEGSPKVAELAQESLSALGLKNVSVVVGPFDDTYETSLQAAQPVDFLFIDGHHDRYATVLYYQQALPYLSDDAIVVFDDICWSDGMRAAWEQIIASKETLVSVDLGPMGLVIASKQGGSPSHFALPVRG